MNDTNAPASSSRRRPNRRLFFLICAIALLPVVLAWGLYHWSIEHGALGEGNHGQLVTPPRPLPKAKLVGLGNKSLPDDAFKHHWSFVYIGGTQCDSKCATRAFEVHNMRWLLQQQYKRLRVFYLAPDAAAMEQAHDAMEDLGGMPVMVTGAKDGGASGLRHFFNQPVGSLMMVDPTGRWMMIYAPGFKMKGVYKDLRHVLHYSALG